MTTLEDLEGRRPRTTIVGGTPILEAQLLASGETADPVANIPDGYRLSTISVNAEKSAAGLLSPGDRVDVQLFMSANARERRARGGYEGHPAEHPRLRVEQAVQRTAEGEESKNDPEDGLVASDARAGEQARLGAEPGRAKPDPAEPERRVARPRSVEVTVSDICWAPGRSTRTLVRTSRTRETGPRRTKGRGYSSRFDGMMSKAAKDRSRRSEMTIVQAEEVSTMQFDQVADRSAAPRRARGLPRRFPPLDRRAGAARTSDGRLDFTGAGSTVTTGGNEDDFPIDFEATI